MKSSSDRAHITQHRSGACLVLIYGSKMCKCRRAGRIYKSDNRWILFLLSLHKNPNTFFSVLMLMKKLFPLFFEKWAAGLPPSWSCYIPSCLFSSASDAAKSCCAQHLLIIFENSVFPGADVKREGGISFAQGQWPINTEDNGNKISSKITPVQSLVNFQCSLFANIELYFLCSVCVHARYF